MVKVTPGLVIGGVATTLAVGTLGYVAYFDYQRRNNPEFRRQLLVEKRKIQKASAAAASREKVAKSEQLKNAVRQMKDERPPQSVEEKEAYFLEQVAIGEALAAKGEVFYIPAAISFFKGLQVYPQPQELLMIYQRTQPAEVVALLMEALKLSIELESSSSSRGAAGRAPRGQAILEEIDSESEKKDDTTTTSSSKPSSQNGDNANSTTSSSPGARSYVDVEYPASSA